MTDQHKKNVVYCATTIVVGAAIGILLFFASDQLHTKDALVSFDPACIREHGMPADCEVAERGHSLYRDFSRAAAKFQAAAVPRFRASARPGVLPSRATMADDPEGIDIQSAAEDEAEIQAAWEEAYANIPKVPDPWNIRMVEESPLQGTKWLEAVKGDLDKLEGKIEARLEEATRQHEEDILAQIDTHLRWRSRAVDKLRRDTIVMSEVAKPK